MPLLADYQNRYSLQIRINLSNPQLTTATTVDSARETNAAADAQADFEAVCGVTYSSSNTAHVTAAVPLVAAKLMVYTGQADDESYDKALRRCERIYRLVLGRNRITPTTDSLLNPTKDTPNTLPWSDRTQFQNYIPNAPGNQTTTDNAQTTTD